jgi:hypothetical protein
MRQWLLELSITWVVLVAGAAAAGITGLRWGRIALVWVAVALWPVLFVTELAKLASFAPDAMHLNSPRLLFTLPALR